MFGDRRARARRLRRYIARGRRCRRRPRPRSCSRNDAIGAVHHRAMGGGRCAPAIDSLVATLDPELVLLGGGLGGAAVKALRAASRRARRGSSARWRRRRWATRPASSARRWRRWISRDEARRPRQRRAGFGQEHDGARALQRDGMAVAGAGHRQGGAVRGDRARRPRLQPHAWARQLSRDVRADRATSPTRRRSCSTPGSASSRAPCSTPMSRTPAFERIAEVWCRAPPDVIGARYAARVSDAAPGIWAWTTCRS